MLIVLLKNNYDTNTSEIEKKLTDHDHDKYITTPEFNTLPADFSNARLAQANLITKTDFDAKLSSLNRKISANKSKHLLVENELKKLKTFDSSYFIGKSHFEEHGTQHYLVFQPMYKYFKRVANPDYILSWRSKEFSDENSTPPSARYYFLNPSLEYLGAKPRVRFSGSCLKQDKVRFTHEKIVNIYIVYEVNKNDNTSNDPTLEHFLFGAVILTKNPDINRYKHSGYGIGFDRHGYYSYPSGRTGRNVIIFAVDMSSSMKIDNRKKDILILGKGPTQGLEHKLSAEKMYSINFTERSKKFCLGLHYSLANSYFFINGKEIYKFKAKHSEFAAAPLCLGNISKDWSVDNMTKTGLNGYVYDFSVDYRGVVVDAILGIHNYLMTKNDMV